MLHALGALETSRLCSVWDRHFMESPPAWSTRRELRLPPSSTTFNLAPSEAFDADSLSLSFVSFDRQQNNNLSTESSQSTVLSGVTNLKPHAITRPVSIHPVSARFSAASIPHCLHSVVPLRAKKKKKQVRIVYFPSALTHSTASFTTKLGIQTYFADPIQYPAFIQLSGTSDVSHPFPQLLYSGSILSRASLPSELLQSGFCVAGAAESLMFGLPHGFEVTPHRPCVPWLLCRRRLLLPRHQFEVDPLRVWGYYVPVGETALG